MPYTNIMRRRLPIGIQDFTDIRERGFCYIDKTAIIHQLISGSGKPFFLSRPRRFGKSLLCSTLEAIFESHRELFGEISGFPALAINSLEWEWKKHPVIRLDLNVGNYSKGTDFLESALNNTLNNVARRHKLELRGKYASERFTNLIMDMHEQAGERVVVIIDEYDKPLLDTMTDSPLHKTIRDELKGFYGILKPSDRYLRNCKIITCETIYALLHNSSFQTARVFLSLSIQNLHQAQFLQVHIYFHHVGIILSAQSW